MGSRAGLNVWRRGKFLLSAGIRIPDRPVRGKKTPNELQIIFNTVLLIAVYSSFTLMTLSADYITYSQMVWAGTAQRYSDSLRAGRSGDRIPVGARSFAPIQTGPGAYPASYTMGTGSFPGVK